MDRLGNGRVVEGGDVEIVGMGGDGLVGPVTGDMRIVMNARLEDGVAILGGWIGTVISDVAKHGWLLTAAERARVRR